MKEMFEASVDGEAYDLERWGQYFKPAGMGQATGDPNKSSTPRAAVAAPTPAAAEEDAPWEEPTTPAVKTAPAAPAGESASRAQDILAMIRNRQK
jgi:hypothetical protein